MQRECRSIEGLLDLHGSIIDQGDGYWVKLEAWRVEPSPQVPHGIRYSLTLHEPGGQRILGYDNAHAVGPRTRFGCTGRVLAYDHKHRHGRDKGRPYEFKDAYGLLADFFEDVDRLLHEVR